MSQQDPSQVNHFYVEVGRAQTALIEVEAVSKREAENLVYEMTPEQIMEAVDDWDWDGGAPVIGGSLTEEELLAGA